MKSIVSILLLLFLIGAINGKESFNSFSINGDLRDCNLVIGTSNKCVNACGRSLSIERKFMSSVDQENLYIFKSYDNDVNCKKNILGKSTDFECVNGSLITIDNITIECKVATEDEIKERSTNTQVNQQINEQINQQHQHSHNQTQQQINQSNNNNNNNSTQQPKLQEQENTIEKSNSSILIYSSSLFILSSILLLL